MESSLGESSQRAETSRLINVAAVEKSLRSLRPSLELSFFVEGAGLNVGLPLADDREARNRQIAEADRKRAAASRGAAPATAPAPTSPRPAPDGAAAAARCSRPSRAGATRADLGRSAASAGAA